MGALKKEVYDKNDESPVTRPDLRAIDGGGESTPRGSGHLALAPDQLKKAEKSAEGGAGDSNDLEVKRLADQLGKGYTSGQSFAQHFAATRMMNILSSKGFKRKAAVRGGIAGGAVTLVLAILGIGSGPAEFIHIAQFLDDIHFGAQSDATDDRFRRAVQYIKSGGQAERTRLGVYANSRADKFEKKLNDSGLKSRYTEHFGYGDGYDVDKNHPKYAGLTDDEIKEKVKTEFGVDAQTDSDGRLVIRTDSATSYRQNTRLTRAALKSAGYGKISAAIKARTMGKRAGVNWHPLKKLDQAALRSAEARIQDFKDRRKGDVGKGHTEVNTTAQSDDDSDDGDRTDDQNAQDEEDEKNANEAKDSADQIADEANEDPDKAKDSIDRKFSAARGGAGFAAVVGIVCLAKGIDDQAADIKKAQVILPLIRISMLAITVGHQIMYGDVKTDSPSPEAGEGGGIAGDALSAEPDKEGTEDINHSDMAELKKLLHKKTTDDDGRVTYENWDDSHAVRAAMGKTGGVEPDETLKTITEHTPFHALNQGRLGEVVGGACSTAGTVVLTALSFLGGPISAAASTIVGLVINATIGPIITNHLAQWLAGEAVDALASGGKLGNYFMFGGAMAANDAALTSAGNKLSPQARIQLQEATQYANRAEFAQKSFASRMFDIEDRNSFIAQVMNQKGGDVKQNLQTVASNILGIKNMFSPTLLAGNLMHAPTVSAAAEGAGTYDYGFDIYGFSPEDLMHESVKNPYENAERAVNILENDDGSISEDGQRYIDRAHDCFGMKLAKVTTDVDGQQVEAWNVTNDVEESVNPYDDKYEDYDCDSTSDNWRTIRFFIFDTTTMAAAACYEGEEDACEDTDINYDRGEEPEGSGPTDFRIATFNVLGIGHTSDANNDPNSPSNYKNRASASTHLAKQNEFDIFGTQEFDEGQLPLFKEGLGTSWSSYPETYRANEGSQRTIFYRNDKFNRIGQGKLMYPSYGAQRDNSNKLENNAAMPWVKLQAESGRTFYVMSTHYVAWNTDPESDPGGAEKREAAAKITRDAVKDLSSDGSPVFLVGDLNSHTYPRPPSDGRQRDAALDGDASRLPFCILSEERVMLNAVDILTGEKTRCGDRRADRRISIDQIWATPTTGVTVGGVQNLAGPIARTGTDHGPFYADVGIDPDSESPASVSGWVWPLARSDWSGPFGTNVWGSSSESPRHGGIDMSVPIGTPVLAAHDGIVVCAGTNSGGPGSCGSGYGGHILVRAAGQRAFFAYQHLNSIESGISAGASVTAGQKIAESGNTGNSGDAHLHFSIEKTSHISTYSDGAGVTNDSQMTSYPPLCFLPNDGRNYGSSVDRNKIIGSEYCQRLLRG